MFFGVLGMLGVSVTPVRVSLAIRRAFQNSRFLRKVAKVLAEEVTLQASVTYMLLIITSENLKTVVEYIFAGMNWWEFLFIVLAVVAQIRLAFIPGPTSVLFFAQKALAFALPVEALVNVARSRPAGCRQEARSPAPASRWSAAGLHPVPGWRGTRAMIVYRNSVSRRRRTAMSFARQLNPGETLYAFPDALPGQSSKVCLLNATFSLSMQIDGNLVLYVDDFLEHAPERRALWAANTISCPVPQTCTMQTNGNLVVYDALHVARRASNTAGHPGAFLRVHDDGNAVIYAPDGVELWSSQTAAGGSSAQEGINTSARSFIGQLNPGEALYANPQAGQTNKLRSVNSTFVLALRVNQNLELSVDDVLESPPLSRALWNAQTTNSGATRCTMQADGNLVMYNAANAPLWASNTVGHPGAYLQIQDDGNLAVYANDHVTILWQTNTGARSQIHL